MGGNAKTKGSLGESGLKKCGSFWWHMAHLIVLSAPPPVKIGQLFIMASDDLWHIILQDL